MKSGILQEFLPRFLNSHHILSREKQPSNTKLIKGILFFVGFKKMLSDGYELECSDIHEGIVDIFHTLRVFWFVDLEVDSFFFIEKFFEVGKYRSDFETPNLSDFFERESLLQIGQCLVVWWDFLS